MFSWFKKKPEPSLERWVIVRETEHFAHLQLNAELNADGRPLEVLEEIRAMGFRVVVCAPNQARGYRFDFACEKPRG